MIMYLHNVCILRIQLFDLRRKMYSKIYTAVVTIIGESMFLSDYGTVLLLLLHKITLQWCSNTTEESQLLFEFLPHSVPRIEVEWGYDMMCCFSSFAWYECKAKGLLSVFQLLSAQLMRYKSRFVSTACHQNLNFLSELIQ